MLLRLLPSRHPTTQTGDRCFSMKSPLPVAVVVHRKEQESKEESSMVCCKQATGRRGTVDSLHGTLQLRPPQDLKYHSISPSILHRCALRIYHQPTKFCIS